MTETRIQASWMLDDIALAERGHAIGNEFVLDDVTPSGRRVEWGKRKMSSGFLAAAYDEIDSHKAERVASCGDRLVFGVDVDGHKRLAAANFCRVRLCPTCQWRRSLKLFGQMKQILQRLEPEGYQYIFLTLTVRNCHMDRLFDEMDALYKGFDRLLKYKEIAAVAKGWYRGLEVTHNLDRDSTSFDTWHPHIHVVIAVNKSYFTSRDYLSQVRWAELWQRALGVDYTPRIDIRKVYGSDVAAICEVTKYAAKSKDYIVLDDWELTVESIRGLDAALHGRRLIGFGGVIRKTRAMLSMDDIEDGDLVNVDGEVDRDKDQYYVSYAWHTGVCQYLREID